MELEPSELHENIEQMSDEELLKMIGDDASQYRSEAIAFAKSELKKRGVVLFPVPTHTECSKCGGRMEEGFIPDFGHLQIVQPVTWVEGKPQTSFWSGTKIGNRRQIGVSAFRCTTCAYIEFYATEDEE